MLVADAGPVAPAGVRGRNYLPRKFWDKLIEIEANAVKLKNIGKLSVFSKKSGQ